jgi:hypothetical protein
MRMSAVSNAFNYFSDTPVAVPLVLGASNRTFNAFPGVGLFGRLLGKQIVPELAEKVVKENADDLAKVAAKQSLEEGLLPGMTKAEKHTWKRNAIDAAVESGDGLVTPAQASKMVRNASIQITLTRNAAKAALILGGGFVLWKFGAGFMGTVGSLLGEAGSAAAENVIDWMGDNPLLATAGVGLGMLFVGGLILTALAPSVAAKKAKDKITQGDEA